MISNEYRGPLRGVLKVVEIHTCFHRHFCEFHRSSNIEAGAAWKRFLVVLCVVFLLTLFMRLLS